MSIVINNTMLSDFDVKVAAYCEHVEKMSRVSRAIGLYVPVSTGKCEALNVI